jgi:hypothetical protein
VIGGKSSSSSSIHERGEETKESKAKLGSFFSGRKFKEGRGEVKKQTKPKQGEVSLKASKCNGADKIVFFCLSHGLLHQL